MEECDVKPTQVKDLTLNTTVMEIPSLTTSNMYSGQICAYRLNEESVCERDGKKMRQITNEIALANCFFQTA